MSAVERVFEKTRAEGRAALVGYLPAGYPTVDGSVEMLSALAAGGCDLLEVGVPYSDPVMDGPTIQAAADIAVARVEPMGGYAVHIAFSDGHARGIFPWSYLRALVAEAVDGPPDAAQAA